MLPLTLALCTFAAAPTRAAEMHSEAFLSLMPGDELRRHLAELDDEIRSLRVVLPVGDVAQRSLDDMLPFVGLVGLPLLGAGILFSSGLRSTGGQQNATVWVGLAVPLAIGLFAALVYLVGSVVDYFAFRVPEHRARAAELTAYRARVVGRFEVGVP